MNEKEAEVIEHLRKILQENDENNTYECTTADEFGTYEDEITMYELKTLFLLIQKQQNTINKMAHKIVKLDNSDQYCLGRKKICPYKKPTLIKCQECVKYYYEKRNKNDYCKSKQMKCN